MEKNQNRKISAEGLSILLLGRGAIMGKKRKKPRALFQLPPLISSEIQYMKVFLK